MLSLVYLRFLPKLQCFHFRSSPSTVLCPVSIGLSPSLATHSLFSLSPLYLNSIKSQRRGGQGEGRGGGDLSAALLSLARVRQSRERWETGVVCVHICVKKKIKSSQCARLSSAPGIIQTFSDLMEYTEAWIGKDAVSLVRPCWCSVMAGLKLHEDCCTVAVCALYLDWAGFVSEWKLWFGAV